MTEEERKALLMMLTPEELIGYANSGTQEPFIDEGRMRLFSQGGDVAAAAQQIYGYIDDGADPVVAAQEFVSGLYPEKYPNMPPDQVQDIVDTVAKTGYGMAKSRASMPTGADQLDKLGLGSLAPLLQYTQKKSAGNYSSPSGMQDTYKSIINRNLGESDRLKNLLFEESKSSKKKDLSNKAKAGGAGAAVGLGVGALPLVAAGLASTGIGTPAAAALMGISLLASTGIGLGIGNKISGPARNEYGYTQKEFEAGRTKKLKGIDAKNARALAALEAEQKKAMARQQLYQDTYDTELAKYKVPSEFDIRKSLMLKVLNG
jgi:hypothetical protein